jgi:diguanylate cyclase (GGDEF)-like protein
MIRGNKSAKVLFFAFAIFLCAAFGALPHARAADGALAVDDKSDALDLAEARNPIVSQRSEISVQGPGEKAPILLKAIGPGPNFYWSLFSFQNNTDHDLTFVLAIEPQRFENSGLVAVKPAGASVLGAVMTKDATPLALGTVDGVRIAQFRVATKETTNIAVESLAPSLSAKLWKTESLQATQGRAAYFKGLVEGFADLIMIGILAAYGFRPNKATLAAWVFALASVLFIETDIGSLSGYVMGNTGLASFAQSASLSLMAGALAACIITFLNLVPSRSVLGAALVASVALAFANMAYSFVEPLWAGTLARFGFAAVVIAGFFATLWHRRYAQDIVDRGLLFWSVILCWAVGAAIVAEVASVGSVLSSELAAALAVVLVCLALVVVRHIFQQGIAARPFVTDANLRSLALSAGRHTMWEWQPAAGHLSVGSDLLKTLDYAATEWGDGLRKRFHDLLHPLDLEAYQKLAERKQFKPSERLRMELRLRDGEGAYRWFDLQATVLPGPGNSIDRCLGTLTDISSLKKVEERIATDALQDMITGLPNKALFLDRLERSLSKLNGLPFRVVVIDLDRFKVLNEGLGQEAGDRILKITAERLSALVEPDETVARIAGGQFALQWHETIERGDFKKSMDDLEAAIAEPIKHGFQHVVLTASIGLSDTSKNDFKAQDLIDQANVAMLDVRAEGGAGNSTFHVEMKDERAKLLSLESDLRRALEKSEIEIFYQPIVYLHSLEVLGFEALARWRHPELGLLSPSEFLDVAETAGMMKEIGQFVLTGAARQLGIWQRVHARGRPFFVSVNVSASQLTNADFPMQIKMVLDRENLLPGSLKIEVTETVIMRQPERTAKILQQFQSMGVGLACDDFGTGFSSLSSLRDFPFDTLKIDRSFLAPEGPDQRNTKIITSITSLANSLGMAVVAEGIETQAQIDRLAELGCGLGQGYFIGMPEPADQAGTRLLRRVISSTPPPATTAPTSLFTPLPPPEASRLHSLYEPAAGSVSVPFAPRRLPMLNEIAGVVEELPSIFTLPQGKAKAKTKPKKLIVKSKRQIAKKRK